VNFVRFDVQGQGFGHRQAVEVDGVRVGAVAAAFAQGARDVDVGRNCTSSEIWPVPSH
jgi:hypothetical protein